MEKVELLSPAGNMESLYAALYGGADAIYIGNKTFSARALIDNFTHEEIIKAINICHLYGVKLYVTLNTLIYEMEIESFLKEVEFLYKHNIDAIILQDIGMMDLLRKKFPNLELHASTNMHIHNLEGVKLLESLNIKRVVLARETDFEVLKTIKEQTNIDLEIFIHGALCISYSGQCLMSSLIGGRSGNQGMCAQCCRMKYRINNKDGYYLSTKDLNTLDNLESLLKLNVKSLKIEGRAKSKEYVYMVTKLYRQAIDNYYNNGKVTYNKEELLKLKTIFNRNFTKGFMFKEVNNNYTNINRPNHQGIKVGNIINITKNYFDIKLTYNININDGIRIINKNNDIGFIVTRMKYIQKDIIRIYRNINVNVNDIVLKTLDYNLTKEIERDLKENIRRIKISGHLYIKDNKLIFNLSDGINNVEISSTNYEIATGTGTSIDIIKRNLLKIKDSIYEYENLAIDLKENIYIKLSNLNEIRRKAISLLDEKRLKKDQFQYIEKEYTINLPNYNKESNFNVLINNYKDYLKYKNNANYIYTDNKKLYEKIKNDQNVVFKFFRVNEIVPTLNNKHLLVGELGSIYKYNNRIIDSDFSLNVINSYAVAFLHSIGVNKVTLSYELTKKQIENIVNNYHTRYKKHPNLEVIVSSYPECMVSKYNLKKEFNQNKNLYLMDKYNNKYLVKENNGYTNIYFYKKKIIDNYQELFNMGINNIRINKDID